MIGDSNVEIREAGIGAWMSRPGRHGRMVSYWPHAGIVIGLVLNAVGLAFGDSGLIATGTNAMTISAAFLLQRRSNRRKDDDG